VNRFCIYGFRLDSPMNFYCFVAKVSDLILPRVGGRGFSPALEFLYFWFITTPALTRHPSSSEAGSFLRTPLLIQEGRRRRRRGGYPHVRGSGCSASKL